MTRSGRRHKTLVDWARQLLLVVRRWWPDRAIIAVADSSYAALELLAACQAWPQPITVITRLRLDAALYAPAPPRRPRQVGRPRLKGQRLPTLAAVAADPTTVLDPAHRPRLVRDRGAGHRGRLGHGRLVPHRPARRCRSAGCSSATRTASSPRRRCSVRTATVAPEQIVAWFVRRWQLEVTFEEARRHLGVETQRQWSEPAIRRTTPALLGLFSVVTLFTQQSRSRTAVRVRQAAWYPKAQPHLCGCPGLGPARTLGRSGFSPVRERTRHDKSPAQVHRAPDGHALLRRLNGQSRG